MKIVILEIEPYQCAAYIRAIETMTAQYGEHPSTWNAVDFLHRLRDQLHVAYVSEQIDSEGRSVAVCH